jgi:hypothetical protein
MQLTEEIAECYRHASRCLERDRRAIDTEAKRDFLVNLWLAATRSPCISPATRCVFLWGGVPQIREMLAVQMGRDRSGKRATAVRSPHFPADTCHRVCAQVRAPKLHGRRPAPQLLAEKRDSVVDVLDVI